MRLSWLLLLIHTGMLQLTSYLVRPAAAYHALDLGVDPALLGLVAASFALLPFLVAVWVGHASDRGYGDLLLVAGAALVLVGAAGLLLLSPTLPSMLAWTACLGVGHLFGVVGEQNRVVASADSAHADAAFGYFTFAGAIGQMLAPLVLALGEAGSGAVIPDTGVLFAAALACAGAVAITTVLLVTWARPVRDPVQPEKERMSLRAALGASRGRRPALVTTVVLSMVVVAVIDLTSIYLPAWGVAYAVPSATVGLLLALRAAAMTVSRPFLGLLARRLGRGPVMLWSCAIAAAGTAVLALPQPVWTIALCLVVSGAALGFGQPLTMSEIAVTAPDRTTNTWLAIRLSGNSLGQTVIPPSVGLITLALGPAGVFAVAGVLLGAATVLNGVTRRRNR